MLAYGVPEDTHDDYMAESTTIVCMCRFCRAIITVFGKNYLRTPKAEHLRSWHKMQIEHFLKCWEALTVYALDMEKLSICTPRHV
jgi:hypothetical protein